ncbi:MAG: PKD domain-containing protein, partial [Chloroflexi bacterium]|nr:PKD domain-containing protein [Chloroflexota bacterium]
TVFLDSNKNGALDSGEPNTATDLKGAYFFGGLAQGIYTIAQVLQPAWFQTAPTPTAHTVSLAPSQVVGDRNFGNLQVINAGPDLTVTEGTAVDLAALLVDPNPANGSNFSYLWHVTASNGQVIADGATANFKFTPFDNGTYLATITVTDIDGGSRKYQDSVEVRVSNIAPRTDLGADRTVNEGALVNFTNAFADPGSNDTLTFLWKVRSTNKQIIADGTGPTFSFTPFDNGAYTVSLRVTDDDDGVGTDEAVVIVNNVAPVADAGSDVTRNEGDQVSLSGSFQDAGSRDTHSFRWRVVNSSNQVILEDSRQNISFPAPDNAVYTATFTVTDDDGAAGSDQVIITINNVAPQNVSAGPNKTVAEGTPVSLNAAFSDPGLQDTHTYNWQVLRSDQVIATGANSTITFTPADNGPYTVTLRVTDDDGGSGTGVTIITVNNIAPTANAGADQIVNEGDPVTLSGGFNDPGSQDTHTLLWQVRNSGGQVIASNTSRELIFTPIDNGAYTATFTVTDDDGGTGSDQVLVTVRNVAPLVTAGQPQTIAEGSPVLLRGSFTDPGSADTHLVQWRVTASNGQFIPAGNAADFQFTPNDNGTYLASFTVTDDDGGRATADVMVVVNNVLPTVNVSGNTAIDEGQLAAFSGSFSDPGADTWRGTVDFGDGSSLPLVLRADKTFGFTHVFTMAGTYNVRLSVADDDAGAEGGGMAAIAVTVRFVNEPPRALASALNDGLAQRSQFTALAVTFSENLSDGLSTKDLLLQNLSAETFIPAEQLALAYNRSTNQATLTFPGLPGQKLPDGNYRLTLIATGITDSGGKTLATDLWLEFHVLTGDVNGDRLTNDLDLYQAWRNQGKSGATALNDDLNGDGQVDAEDASAIRNNYLASLPPPLGQAASGLHQRNPITSTTSKPPAESPLAGQAYSSLAFLTPNAPAFSSKSLVSSLGLEAWTWDDITDNLANVRSRPFRLWPGLAELAQSQSRFTGFSVAQLLEQPSERLTWTDMRPTHALSPIWRNLDDSTGRGEGVRGIHPAIVSRLL